ncbi:unnamed protein product [Amaranthus hypochondriacus]
MSEGMFNIQLFDGRINFAMWKSSVEDYLVQLGIDDALLKERPNNIEEEKWIQIRKKAVSTIRLAIAPEIKYHYLKETDPSDKECYYCKKKGHIQIMCQEFKKDLKRMKSLRDGERHEHESSGSPALGFVGDDDYDGALLVDEGVVHS